MKPNFEKISEFFDQQAKDWDQRTREKDDMFTSLIYLTQGEENQRILDIGCGTGILEKHLLKTSPKEIVALDISSNMIAKAKEKYNHENINFLTCNIFDYEDNNTFDSIYIYNVYPHIMNKEDLLTKIDELTHKGSRLVIAHGLSRQTVNSIHHKLDFKLSDSLLEAKEEVKLWTDMFDIDILVDNDSMYIISGIKK